MPALGASGIGAAGNATQLAAAAAAATSASVSETTERIRVTIDKIAEHDKEPVRWPRDRSLSVIFISLFCVKLQKGQLDMTMKRNGAVVDDACFESSLVRLCRVPLDAHLSSSVVVVVGCVGGSERSRDGAADGRQSRVGRVRERTRRRVRRRVARARVDDPRALVGHRAARRRRRLRLARLLRRQRLRVHARLRSPSTLLLCSETKR